MKVAVHDVREEIKVNMLLAPNEMNRLTGLHHNGVGWPEARQIASINDADRELLFSAGAILWAVTALHVDKDGLQAISIYPVVLSRYNSDIEPDTMTREMLVVWAGHFGFHVRHDGKAIVIEYTRGPKGQQISRRFYSEREAQMWLDGWHCRRG